MRITFLLLLLLLPLLMLGKEQGLSPDKYGVALSELTTYADHPGFMDEVILNEDYKEIGWKVDEDGYYFTHFIEHTYVFTYKTIYSIDNTHIVKVYLSSTGTAELSYILKLEAFEDRLVLLNVIAGGDRCHQGVKVDEVEIENDVMHYTYLITPQYFMSWNKQIKQNKSYADCMMCCFGLANYSYDLLQEEPALESIVLYSDAIEEEGAIRKVYDEYTNNMEDKSMLLLSETEVIDFQNKVVQYDESSR